MVSRDPSLSLFEFGGGVENKTHHNGNTWYYMNSLPTVLTEKRQKEDSVEEL